MSICRDPRNNRTIFTVKLNNFEEYMACHLLGVDHGRVDQMTDYIVEKLRERIKKLAQSFIDKARYEGDAYQYSQEYMTLCSSRPTQPEEDKHV
jgi:hypothetical protein